MENRISDIYETRKRRSTRLNQETLVLYNFGFLPDEIILAEDDHRCSIPMMVPKAFMQPHDQDNVK